MKRFISHLIIWPFTFILLYISRFWVFEWWERPGLFDLKALPPTGNLVQRWLRGTEFAPYDLLIWVIAVFLFLTILQKFYDHFFAS